MDTFDVVILSVYGRGAWLAGALSRIKKKTAFIDLSQALSAGSEEDLEGPFGFSLLPQLSPLQQEWFKERWLCSPEGFCLLAGGKVFHFKETLLFPVYKKRPEYMEVLKYFKTGCLSSKPDFKKHWIIHLLRQLNAGTQNPAEEAGPALQVFEDFGVLAYEKNFSSLLPEEVFFHQQKDHHFLLPESDRDFVISSRTGQSIKAKYLVFTLTPFETDKLHPSLCRLIFSKKKIVPQQTWQRFNFTWDSGGYSFPSYMVTADPYELPWTKERLLVLKKSLRLENQMNVWARMPFGQQLDSSSKDIQNIVLKLEKSFPGFLKKFNPPAAGGRDVLFPIYSAEDARKIKFISHPRFFYSFDILDLSPTRQALREKEIFTKIQTMDSSP